MQITTLPHWQRQQLAATERLQSDLQRFTNPIVQIFSVAMGVYLPCYAKVMLFGVPDQLDLYSVLLVLSLALLVLMSPAFAVVAGVETYFRRSLARLSEQAQAAV